MTRHVPLRSKTPLQRRTRIRPRAQRRSTRVVDEVYLAWVRRQPSIVSYRDAERVLGSHVDWNRRIEAHHHRPGDDHSALPLYWWLHQWTSISVHGGGGRRTFARRFGIDWRAAVRELNARYEAETGRRLAA